MKRSSLSPLFSSADRWSLTQTPAQRPIATIQACDPGPTTEQNALSLALREAQPMVWGDHQGLSDQTTTGAHRACLPDTGTLPPLFQSAGDLRQVGQQAERVLLDAASDPERFLTTLKHLLGPAWQLAAHPDIHPTQSACLERLPMTALAIAHQQGLTRNAECLVAITALVLEHKDGLTEGEQCLLLGDLETVLQDHASTHGALMSKLRSQRQALEHINDLVDAPPRDLRTLGQALLDAKQASLKTLLNQPPPCGPLFIAQWAWATQHWTEPDLRPYLLEGVAQLLTEAAQGVRDGNPFQGSFLFDLFPENLLLDAFDRVGTPDNTRLLQLRPMTPRGQTLLNHCRGNPDLPQADRQRLRDWYGMA